MSKLIWLFQYVLDQKIDSNTSLYCLFSFHHDSNCKIRVQANSDFIHFMTCHNCYHKTANTELFILLKKNKLTTWVESNKCYQIRFFLTPNLYCQLKNGKRHFPLLTFKLKFNTHENRTDLHRLFGSRSLLHYI